MLLLAASAERSSAVEALRPAFVHERFPKLRDISAIVVLNVRMAGKASSGSATTAPKGRATRGRSDADEGRSFMSPTMQWVLAVLVVLAIIGGILYFGRDIGSNYGGGGGHSAPAPSMVIDDTSGV
jgi:hypothetical protein